MNKKLIVLDIDGTLVHADYAFEDQLNWDFTIENETIRVWKRFDLDLFLQYVFENYRVGIWSLSGKDYVEAILKGILSNNMKPEFIWTTERCTRRMVREGLMENSYAYIKNMKKLWHKYDKYTTLIVDDTPFTYSQNYGNAVPIKTFTSGCDSEFKRIIILLKNLEHCKNVRCIEKRLT